VYRAVACTEWWGVQIGGVYRVVGCTEWWGVQSGGVYRVVGSTEWWGLQSGGGCLRDRLYWVSLLREDTF